MASTTHPMKIPFTKAHGARNDFLLTWRDRVPAQDDLAAISRAICDRHTGAGADGWLLISAGPDGKASAGTDADARIDLWNSDGSRSEMSGNGTRCAAAFLVDAGLAGDQVRIATGAGLKHLRLLERHGRSFSFEMNMGRPVVEDARAVIDVLDPEILEAAILNVGNPQCAVFVEDFDFDWRGLGAQLAIHPRFPNGTNVSFVKVVDEHNIEVRFIERGAGETMSSGTGSTGAAAAAVAREFAQNPVRVLTPAGPLDVRWEGDDVIMAGPAEIVATGEFFWGE